MVRYYPSLNLIIRPRKSFVTKTIFSSDKEYVVYQSPIWDSSQNESVLKEEWKG